MNHGICSSFTPGCVLIFQLFLYHLKCSMVVGTPAAADWLAVVLFFLESFVFFIIVQYDNNSANRGQYC